MGPVSMGQPYTSHARNPSRLQPYVVDNVIHVRDRQPAVAAGILHGEGTRRAGRHLQGLVEEVGLWSLIHVFPTCCATCAVIESQDSPSGISAWTSSI